VLTRSERPGDTKVCRRKAGRPRVAALLAPELDQQIGFAIDHLRHLVEARRGIHVAGDFHDPLDAIEVDSSLQQWVVAADEHGVIRARLDDDPITGPDYWQRAGNAIGSYLFRSPSDGSPLCIGGRGHPNGWGQLRRVLDATPFHGKSVRFTALVATRDTAEVRLWLAVGDSRVVMRGGDTRHNPLHGTHDWTPMSLTITNVPTGATKLSYGFLLYGVGDVWVTQPRIEIVDAAEADGRPSQRLMPANGR